jgi:hypothetical protein
VNLNPPLLVALQQVKPNKNEISRATYDLITDPSWTLKKSKNNINIFVRGSKISGINEFMGVLKTNACIDDVEKLLLDSETTDKWLYNSLGANEIKRNSVRDVTVYSKTNVPWPLTSRDSVINMQHFTYESGNRSIITMLGLPDSIPEEANYVRVPLLFGFWELVQGEASQLDITYHLMLDPGGNIPQWIINMFTVDTPFESLKAIDGLLAGSNCESYQPVTFKSL